MKTAIMRVEFDDECVMYYEPHSFMLLSNMFDRVKNWERLEMYLSDVKILQKIQEKALLPL